MGRRGRSEKEDDDDDDSRRGRSKRSSSSHRKRRDRSTSQRAAEDIPGKDDHDHHKKRSRDRKRHRRDGHRHRRRSSSSSRDREDGNNDKHHDGSQKKKRRRETSPESFSSSASPSSSLSVNDKDKDKNSTGGDDGGDDSSTSRDSRRRRKRSKEKKRRKDDKKSKRAKDKKPKKSKKKRKHHHRDDDKEPSSRQGKNPKRSSSAHDGDSDNDDDDARVMRTNARNYELAEALHQLLADHPTAADMACNTLPLLLVKLGSGATLDLRRMPDSGAAEGLKRVLQSLRPFGVTEDEEAAHVWKWTVPGAAAGSSLATTTTRRDERILLRIVRTMLNDIGFTMDSVAVADRQQQNEKMQQKSNCGSTTTTTIRTNNNKKGKEDLHQEDENELMAIKDHTRTMLQSFQQKKGNADDDAAPPSTLPGELGGLCKMILDGESIALHGLPDANLRTALEQLFQSCGLELFEMEEEESDSEEDGHDGNGDDDENRKKSASMGYGLPETTEEQQEAVKAKILSVMSACEQAASTRAMTTTKAVKGPTPMPSGYQAPDDEGSSDEEGPAPIGSARLKEPANNNKELIQQQADMRARQLRGAVTGQEELMSTDPNQREEWMLVPGKFDFLSAIKAGNPMKSRNFKAQSKAESMSSEQQQQVVDPKIRAEMDAIMQAHAEARGPTLAEQHRQKKEQERQEKAAAAGGQRGQWNWSRDQDLDSGRRVDKNALHMILGGATQDLKKKFQGGF